MRDLGGTIWHKSSRSNNSNNCVEVAIGRSDSGGVVGVRDSKDADGPVLIFQSAGWVAFVTGARAGAFASQPAV